VVGIASGGNAVLGTYAFVQHGTLVLGGVQEPSYVFMNVGPEVTVPEMIARVDQEDGMHAMTRDEFLNANQALTRQIVLPLIAIVVGIAIAVGGTIVGLTLYTVTMERREEYGLMKALGLTHGGFYAHFESKDALVQASLEAAAEQTLERWQASGASEPAAGEPAANDPASTPLRTIIDWYLSTQHRDEPEEGCPLPTLAAELGLRGQPSKTADTMVAHLTAQLADSRLAVGAGHEGIVALAAMVGALTLARAVSDRDASDRILAAVREALSRLAGKEAAATEPGARDEGPGDGAWERDSWAGDIAARRITGFIAGRRDARCWGRFWRRSA